MQPITQFCFKQAMWLRLILVLCVAQFYRQFATQSKRLIFQLDEKIYFNLEHLNLETYQSSLSAQYKQTDDTDIAKRRGGLLANCE